MHYVLKQAIRNRGSLGSFKFDRRCPKDNQSDLGVVLPFLKHNTWHDNSEIYLRVG